MADALPFDPLPILAAELHLPPASVAAVLRLLDEGATVPFLARYRKEVTGGLDEVAIRAISERRDVLVDLDKRRRAILESIAEQGKLTDGLRAALLACVTKAELEDLYLPYRPKRRTRAGMARERGLEPLAARILAQPRTGDPRIDARAFVNATDDATKGVADVDAALAGARDIVAEVAADRADVRARVRQTLRERGVLRSDAIKSKVTGPTKFEGYYEYREGLARLPSHRYLAVRRGEAEGILRVKLEADDAPLIEWTLARMNHDRRSPWAGEMAAAIDDAFSRLIRPAVDGEVLGEVAARAERDAVEVFAANLRELLLAPPFGSRSVVGVDPGLRTGCKCAAVDAQGAFQGHVTVYPHSGDASAARARDDFGAFVGRHRPDAVAVGNGTAGRETEAFVRDALAAAGVKDVLIVAVSESGASVYSASDVARLEFPDLDLTVRGAISIARRLQDPLSELVKVDPQSIGVGQYQHDVAEGLLKKRLDQVVEDCVNGVGVEVNTASAALLAYVSGIGPGLAKAIVAERDRRGGITSRKDLLAVPRLGPRTFEQAAGFLRVRGGTHPLDASAVHPERYGLVEKMARDLGVTLASLVGHAEAVERIEPARYAGGDVGLPTLVDILAELKKPGRDPRREFEAPQFRDDVRTLEDLKTGMELEGVVTNVTAFGAFVDIGVHQDGLVHVSELADRFVRQPSEVARPGMRLKVRVLAVDLPRRRISLSAKGLDNRL
jgi:uncharacterized protein